MTEQEEQTLRYWLWLKHKGSDCHLYGDDGEMQCGKCGLDFKRDSVERINEVFNKQAFQNMNEYARTQKSVISDGSI